MTTTLPLANSLHRATLDALRRQAPFSTMDEDELLWLVQRLAVAYYAAGEALLLPADVAPATLFIVKQGTVDGVTADGHSVFQLTVGEMFPLGALLAGRGVANRYVAETDTFCYLLPAADFHTLLTKSAEFQDFCTRRIANLLEQSKQVIQAQYSRSGAEQQSLSSPLSAVIRREPVSCAPGTPVREVLETMHALGIGSMVVTEEKRPVGIFTLHDVLNRVALAQLDLDQPIRSVMSGNLSTLPPQAFAYEAALEMAKHGFRHVLVMENGAACADTEVVDGTVQDTDRIDYLRDHLAAAERLDASTGELDSGVWEHQGILWLRNASRIWVNRSPPRTPPGRLPPMVGPRYESPPPPPPGT